MRNLLLLSATLARVQLVAFNNGSAVGSTDVAGAGEACETVTIKTKNGPVDINKSEYDANPKKYTLHEHATRTHNADGSPKKPDPETEGKAFTEDEKALRKRIAETTLGVVQEGTRFFIVVTDFDGTVKHRANMTEDGKPMKKAEIEKDGFPDIEIKGYDNSKDAWDQVFRLRTMASEVAATPAGQ